MLQLILLTQTADLTLQLLILTFQLLDLDCTVLQFSLYLFNEQCLLSDLLVKFDNLIL